MSTDREGTSEAPEEIADEALDDVQGGARASSSTVLTTEAVKKPVAAIDETVDRSNLTLP